MQQTSQQSYKNNDRYCDDVLSVQTTTRCTLENIPAATTVEAVAMIGLGEEGPHVSNKFIHEFRMSYKYVCTVSAKIRKPTALLRVIIVLYISSSNITKKELPDFTTILIQISSHLKYSHNQSFLDKFFILSAAKYDNYIPNMK